MTSWISSPEKRGRTLESARAGSSGELGDVLQRVVDASLAGVIFAAPLVLGGRHDLGRLALVVLAAIGAGACFVRQAIVGERVRTSRWPLVLFALAGALLVFQLTPLPAQWLSRLSPRTAELLPLWSGTRQPGAGYVAHALARSRGDAALAGHARRLRAVVCHGDSARAGGSRRSAVSEMGRPVRGPDGGDRLGAVRHGNRQNPVDLRPPLARRQPAAERGVRQPQSLRPFPGAGHSRVGRVADAEAAYAARRCANTSAAARRIAHRVLSTQYSVPNTEYSVLRTEYSASRFRLAPQHGKDSCPRGTINSDHRGGAVVLFARRRPGGRGREHRRCRLPASRWSSCGPASRGACRRGPHGISRGITDRLRPVCPASRFAHRPVAR